MAHQARRLPTHVAAPVVRPEAGQASLVQKFQRHALLRPPRSHRGRQVSDRQGRGGHHQQGLRLRGFDEPGHDVLHRRLREGKGGLDQLDR